MPKPITQICSNEDQLKIMFYNARKAINVGKPVKVTMTTELNRSLDQNAWLHKLFEIIAETYKHKYLHGSNIEGFAKGMSYWKAYCKEKLGKKNVYFDLEERPFVEVVSTREYSKAELNDFITKIQAHFKQEFKIDLPEPKEG